MFIVIRINTQRVIWIDDIYQLRMQYDMIIVERRMLTLSIQLVIWDQRQYVISGFFSDI